jgi:quercetin dioxygenase-like cupin family protein
MEDTVILKRFENVLSQPYGQGAQKRVVIGAADGAPTFVMRIFDVIPGGASSDHAHDFEHEVLILKGQATLKSDGPDRLVDEGTAIFIPANERHQLVNTSRDTLRFMCCVPLRGEDSPGISSGAGC